MSDPTELHQAKPITVRLAVICLWISAVSTLVIALVLPIGDRGFTVAAGFIMFALMGFIAARIWARRAWARWLFLVFYVLNLISNLSALGAFLLEPLVVQACAIGLYALFTAAFILLLTRTSRQWFKSSRAATRPNAL